MDTFNSLRRDFLRTGGLGAAAAALPAVSFAASKERSAIVQSDVIFNIRNFGATGDGKTVDTPAVNRAIEAAEAAGGGVVVFPPGVYLCFSIHLKSHVHLHLEEGSAIVAAESPLPGQTTGYNGGVYDAAEPNTEWDAYQDYGHNHWKNSLMWGIEIHDISITGTGLIWGKGLSFGAGPGRPPGAPAGGFSPAPSGRAPANGRPSSGAPGATEAGITAPRRRFTRGDYPMYQAEQPGVGNKAIALKNCRNVTFRDFSVLKGGHFALLLTGVDNVTIDNLKIDTDRDGIDIDCCQNVRVSNCTVNSPWDDGICPKSSYALGYARATRNLTIDSCYVSGYYELGSVLDGTFKKMPPETRIAHNGRIKCGTESNGGFINITISNCILEGSQGYALESVDGALLEDIAIVNSTMRDMSTGPLFLRLGRRLRGPKDVSKVGTMRRILISNLECYNATKRQASILTGIPGYSIQDVKLSNIYFESAGGGTAEDAKAMPTEQEDNYPDPGRFGITPSSGFFLRHLKNLEMSHVQIANTAPDARPAFYLSDVDRADFFAITAPRTADGAFVLQNVKDLRIGWSRAAADTTLATVDNKML